MFNKKSLILIPVLLAAVMVWTAIPALAKVSAEEAERLKKDLTPVGAERAGNAEGTIPAWEGGLSKIPDNVTYTPDSEMDRPNPFPDDKVLFTITAQNVDKYADKLSPGMVNMFKLYPETWKMNIYPTRRTCAVSQDTYDRTYQNATRAELTSDGHQGSHGGYPFPIPQNGAELIINHKANYSLSTKGNETFTNGILVHPDGTMVSGGVTQSLKKDMADGLSYEEYQAKNIDYIAVYTYLAPPRKKGEWILGIAPFDYSKTDIAVFQYMPGQRRIRRAPNIGYDTPNPVFGGYATYDDSLMFNGRMDRFDWNNKGKKEMYISYNNYGFFRTHSVKEFATPKHPNPEKIRWELHRVWELEAVLKKGKSHCYGRRVFYLDEDSWSCAVRDQYDTRGTLWRMAFIMNSQYYELPLLSYVCTPMFDFQVDTYSLDTVNTSDMPKFRYNIELPESYFSLQNLRSMGKR